MRIFLCLSVAAAAGLFTKQLRCVNSTCTNVLSGLITLTNEEAFEYESFNVKDVVPPDAAGASETEGGAGAGAAPDIPVLLKIEKSRLLIAYGLNWESDVLGGVQENVYDYSWASAGGSHAFEGSDFDGNRCQDEFKAAHGNDTLSIDEVKDLVDTSAFEDVKQLVNGGRVCGCKDTGWGGGSYTDVQRASLNCNAWPAVFRPGSTTWAARHCPVMKGPIYNVYSIREWKWEYHVKVTMSWTTLAGLARTRTYYLNWTTPEVKDEELDFTFKILFSLPQFGQQPPDLHATHYLLVPKGKPPPGVSDPPVNQNDLLLSKMNSEERQLAALSSSSLLVPKEMVDLSGRGCDKIGVSMFTWAREENLSELSWVGDKDFCGAKAGTCIHLQPNDLLNADLKLIADGKSPDYVLYNKTLDGWSSDAPYLLSDREIFSPERSGESSTPEPSSGGGRGTAAISGRRLQDASPPAGNAPSASIIAWPTDQSHSTQLEVSLNSSDIAWLPNLSMGEIEDISSYPTGSSTSILVLVRNKEAKEAKFTIAVNRCELVNDSSSAEETLLETPRSLSAAPVSKLIKGDRTGGIVVTIDRGTGMAEAEYDCVIQLLNSQGSVLKNETVTIQFDERKSMLGSANRPLQQGNNPVNNFKINPSDLSAVPFAQQNLRAIGEGSGNWYGSCDCDLWNLWCFATHIVDCTKLVRSIIIFGASLVGCCVLVVAFLPCLVRSAAACFSFTAKQVEKSRKELRRRNSAPDVSPVDMIRREVTTTVESDSSSAVYTPTQLYTPGRALNRAVRSRRGASLDHNWTPATAEIAPASARLSKNSISRRRSSRRYSPGYYIAREEIRPCYSSRPTTATSKKTPAVTRRPSEQHPHHHYHRVVPVTVAATAEQERRRQVLHTLREKRKIRVRNNSSFADDDSSSAAAAYDEDRPVSPFCR